MLKLNQRMLSIWSNLMSLLLDTPLFATVYCINSCHSSSTVTMLFNLSYKMVHNNYNVIIQTINTHIVFVCSTKREHCHYID